MAARNIEGNKKYAAINMTMDVVILDADDDMFAALYFIMMMSSQIINIMNMR